MNFLAHIFLTKKHTPLMIGNFLADFLKGKKQLEHLPKGVLEGIYLHRKIDHFTDHHELVKVGYQRLKPSQGRYASVITDIYFDYFLIKNWSKYTETPLSTFLPPVYEALLDHIDLYPKKIQKRVRLMIADNWLFQYGKLDGLRFTFDRVADRTSFDHNLGKAVDDLVKYEAEFDAEFNVFFPELIDFVNKEMANFQAE